MKHLFRRFGARLTIFGILALFGAHPSRAVTLGTASSFAVLGASTVTNTGPSIISGNLGVSPGTAITGFGPGTVVNGAIHAGDAVATAAHADAAVAYAALLAMVAPPANDLSGRDLGGMTLAPGIYHFASSAQLTGILTLDAQGDPNALFVFQIGSTLVTAVNSKVIMIHGGQSCVGANVYWQVTSSATIGTGTAFVGHILALASITLNANVMLSGSAIAITAAVTMDTDNVSVCGTNGQGNTGGDKGKDKDKDKDGKKGNNGHHYGSDKDGDGKDDDGREGHDDMHIDKK